MSKIDFMVHTADTDLIIGHNYADIFGLDNNKAAMIYNGGISWTARCLVSGKEMTMDSDAQTKTVREVLTRKPVMKGSI